MVYYTVFHHCNKTPEIINLVKGEFWLMLLVHGYLTLLLWPVMAQYIMIETLGGDLVISWWPGSNERVTGRTRVPISPSRAATPPQ
jgi:hypothetical protein